jgi:hypothetical protein
MIQQTPKPRGRPKMPISQRDASAILAAQHGRTSHEIAADLGVTNGAVMCVLSRARATGITIPMRKRGPRGPVGWRDRLAT